MHAVVEALSILFEVPRQPDEPKGRWIARAGGVFGLTFSQAKKIIYGEVKDLRATRLDAMRERLDELKESAVKRRERLNEIAIGIATARADRAADRARGEPVPDRGAGGPAGGGCTGASGSGVPGDRPSAAFIRPAR